MNMDISNQILNGMKEYINDENVLLTLVYGSQSWNNINKKDTDIDMMFIVKNTDNAFKNQLIQKFIQLNLSLQYKLDTEVPYDNKLVIDMKAIISAVEGQAFKTNNIFIIPPIIKDELFLKSKDIQLRLILSALTTNPILLSGDVKLFVLIKHLAFVAILNIITNFFHFYSFTVHDLLEKLLTNGINSGEEYLGYKNNPIQIESYRVFVTEQLHVLILNEVASFKNGIYHLDSYALECYHTEKITELRMFQ
ncbi:aminotransferase [Bacillus cereus]|uniref:Uncharacterized protein n=2 Tax=Bacillus cereus group TaxID=86661 RepID=A0A9W5KQZ2_BACCE|nr:MULTISPECIES: hypothetical protein [Bacillus cereus group]MEB8729588.1 aminotransferase [Bacillus cereus]EEM44109.1 Aminotransferase, classes I and II [Bacillus thuringiensis serovar pakistani str. T13001]EJR60972.1 hypothetical protein IK5_06120 [Bacillus cereus VD154]KIU73053.1 hypothetical protein C797_19980 [Bacillus thuringiensis Sbt003]MEB8752327.1 aminotransferase [Bacillus cereus]